MNNSLVSDRPATWSMIYTAVAVLPLYLLGAFSVRLQSQLGFDTTELGVVLGAFFLTGAAVSVSAAPLVDRVGASIALRTGAGASAAASLSVAFVATSWHGLAAAMAMCGIAHAATQIGANRLLATSVSKRRRAVSFGAKQAAVPIASLSAGLIASSLHTSDASTQAFLMAAALAVAAGLSVPHVHAMGGRSERPATTLRSARLYMLAGAAAMAAASGNAVSLLIVDSIDARGLSAAVGGAMLAAGSALAMSVRVGAGILVDKRGSNGTRELRALLLLGALGFGLLAASDLSWELFVVGTLLAFAAGWGWQGLIFFSAIEIGGVPPATATGVVLAGTMGGSAIGPPSVAFLADSFGYRSGWALAGALLVMSAVLTSRSSAATSMSSTATSREASE